MKKIFLNKNKHALVDDEDYGWLSKYKWTAKESGGNIFYAIRRNPENGKHLYMHKVIMGNLRGFEVDHANGDSLDNRKSNLRICSHKQNLRNQKLSSANTSGYKGVYLRKDTKKWEAGIKVNQKRIVLGSFDDILDAAKAYNNAAIEYFGEFARLNSI